VATNDQARTLNAAIREQVVASVGVGDLIVTRDNDHDVDVANRDTWTVTTVHADGSTHRHPHQRRRTRRRSDPPGRLCQQAPPAHRTRLRRHRARHPGETAHTGHLVLDEHTSAASAYVGETRGRTANDLHLVAEDLDDARAQWTTPPTAATPTSASTPPARPPIAALAATPNPPPQRPASARPPTPAGSPTYSTSCAPPGPTRPTPAPR